MSGGGVRFTYRPLLASVVPFVFFGALVFIAVELHRSGSQVDLRDPLTVFVVGLAFLPLVIGVFMLSIRHRAVVRPDGSVRLSFGSLFGRRLIDIPAEDARVDIAEYTHRQNSLISFVLRPLHHVASGPTVERYRCLVLHNGSEAMLLGLSGSDHRLKELAQELESNYNLRASDTGVRVVAA